MRKIWTTLENVISKDKNINILFRIIIWIWVVGSIIMFIYSFFIVEKYFSEWSLVLFSMSILVPTIGIGLFFFILIWISRLPSIIMWNISKEWRIITIILNKEEKKISNIETILNSIESLRLIMRRFSIMRKLFWYLLTKTTNNALNIYSETVHINALNILYDLRNDLTLRIDSKKNILESAKSEVSKNIQWTTELDQVSELQKGRLDRQIEQFEELQRVLVKV